MEDDEAGAVDWNVVQMQLDSIGDPWKQPRLDSLPHVVEVLTSPNPEQTLQSLREQRDLVEHLVDGVVHNYNAGFSKASSSSAFLNLF
jgi:exocyst complex component 4